MFAKMTGFISFNFQEANIGYIKAFSYQREYDECDRCKEGINNKMIDTDQIL